jgi:predicted transcriptional regulator
MSEEETKLNDRDIYLLGVLAECNDSRVIGTANLPRGCNAIQAQALVQAGYLLEIPQRLADGRHAAIYDITQKGIDAWKGYRFVRSNADEGLNARQHV